MKLYLPLFNFLPLFFTQPIKQLKCIMIHKKKRKKSSLGIEGKGESAYKERKDVFSNLEEFFFILVTSEGRKVNEVCIIKLRRAKEKRKCILLLPPFFPIQFRKGWHKYTMKNKGVKLNRRELSLELSKYYILKKDVKLF